MSTGFQCGYSVAQAKVILPIALQRSPGFSMGSRMLDSAASLNHEYRFWTTDDLIRLRALLAPSKTTVCPVVSAAV